MALGAQVADAWLPTAAERWMCTLGDSSDAGLIADLATLDGPVFDHTLLHPAVRDFYEHTARWEMDAWNEWSPAFRPGGELVAMAFGRRVQQLALPMRAMELSRGMSSSVTPFVDGAGVQQAAAWQRTLKSNGSYVFSGCYRRAQLPDREQPVVHVSFPLQSGNVQVFLEPSADQDGSLWLHSPGGDFGEPGAYVVVEEDGTHAAQVPAHETFHVFVDHEDVVRCDHVLSMWRRPAMRLHYRLSRR